MKTLGSHETAPSSNALGMPNYGSRYGSSSNYGSNFSFTPSFSFGSNGFDFGGGTFDFTQSDYGFDPVFDLKFDPGTVEDEIDQGDSWLDFAKTLLKLGPAYISAFTDGKVPAPQSAPPQAKSNDASQREEAMIREIARLQQQQAGGGGGGGGGAFGLTPTTAILGAGVAASLVIALTR